jgi:hypothetical protein
MEIFGGFMVMMSIIGLFLAVIWLIMPFVVFAIKGKQDRSLELIEAMDARLAAIDKKLAQLQTAHETVTPPVISHSEQNRTTIDNSPTPP